MVTPSMVKPLKRQLYIGLMSGTSADGIDLALIDVTDENQIINVASSYQSYCQDVIDKITSLYSPQHNEIDRAFALDVELAHLFSQNINQFIHDQGLTAADIKAIGNHGQTIRHRPTGDLPFTLQIGCCQTLATLTGIKVIGQFRRKDMALGGQGAPLVPIFHQQLFAQQNDNVFLINIGGIANLTFLPAGNEHRAVLGFDTGPGNALLDDWYSKHHPNSHNKFDQGGEWAASGHVNQQLLSQLLADEFIGKAAPKSTGREYFNLHWLTEQLTAKKSVKQLAAQDIQATLLAFTAHTICDAIKAICTQGQVYLCGGGVHNTALTKLIALLLGENFQLKDINQNQVESDSLEAMAFAWLAYAFEHNVPSNVPEVTGASRQCTLGTAYLP